MAHATESDHKVVERARRLTAYEDFKKFILRGNLVDLAVAVVIGTAFTGLVKALVTDFITPLIAAIGGQRNFDMSFFTLNHSKFMYGDFVNNVVSFLIMAAIVFYFVVLPVNKILEHFKPTPDAPAPTQTCTNCLSKVPAAATVCAFCTRDIEPAPTPAA